LTWLPRDLKHDRGRVIFFFSPPPRGIPAQADPWLVRAVPQTPPNFLQRSLFPAVLAFALQLLAPLRTVDFPSWDHVTTFVFVREQIDPTPIAIASLSTLRFPFPFEVAQASPLSENTQVATFRSMKLTSLVFPNFQTRLPF